MLNLHFKYYLPLLVHFYTHKKKLLNTYDYTNGIRILLIYIYIIMIFHIINMSSIYSTRD